MASVINKLAERNLISPPKWLPNNTMFEGLTGSVAYGASDDTSDMDVVGFCMPPKSLVFPHTTGEIFGFGRQIQRFEQYQQHHVDVPEWKKEYDLTIYSIVKFFNLAMENNPNMVDTMFLPRRCVLHSTLIYEKIREHRKLFLHKGSWHKFRGYSFSQMSKINKGTNSSNPKRQKSIEDHGYDVKFAYHVVRLLLEVEQIMETGDLNLERDREVYKAIRRGEWSLDQLNEWATDKESDLEKLYATTNLPQYPPEDDLRALLIECMEMHYGSLEDIVVKPTRDLQLLNELKELVNKHDI